MLGVMRAGFFLPVGVVLTTTVLIVTMSRGGEQADAFEQPARSIQGLEWVSDAVAYRDPDYDFTLAVPAGWQSIVAMSEHHADDIGHIIGFEAPRDGENDPFADYVMIEILPGSESGRFETDGSRARPVTIDGISGIREDLAIDGHDLGSTVLDLIVFQAEIRGLGYTVGFYAIGEPSRRVLLDEAFELMIRTFEFELPPFRIS